MSAQNLTVQQAAALLRAQIEKLTAAAEQHVGEAEGGSPALQAWTANNLINVAGVLRWPIECLDGTFLAKYGNRAEEAGAERQ